MGIFPWDWSAEGTRVFWLIMLCTLVIIVFILICGFLFPTPLKRARQRLDVQMSIRSGPEEWVDRAFKTLQEHGYAHITREQILTLPDDDIQRLDHDSRSAVATAQFSAAQDKSMMAYKKFLEQQTWWSYRVYVWRAELNQSQTRVVGVALIFMALAVAYAQAVLATLEASSR